VSVNRARLSLSFVAAAAVVACQTPPPHITFTETPPAGLGGPVRTAAIAGRVEGARPGDRIVLFAKSAVWYVQPLRDNPFTAIDAQGRWRSTIHLGSEYAAMVVREGYRPPESTPALPGPGNHVLAIATVSGRGSGYVNAPAAPLQFSGYEWEVRQHGSDRGGANEYHAANASVDASGALRLKLVQRDRQWTSAEVCLTRPLGYGTYVFVVRDMTAVDPAARLALFTFDEDGRAEHFREMNIDLWRDNQPGAMAGQFVLQPNYLPGNLHRFSLPGGRVSHTIRWEPGVVAFKSMRGSFLERPGAVIASQTSTTGVPGPGDERARMAFYYYRKGERPPRTDTEIVIERFQHLP
jgi:hypothetical protein